MKQLSTASWVIHSMANSMMKVKGIVAILLFVMLAVTVLTGLMGGESEGNGAGEGSSLHVVSAAAVGLLAVIHILLNGNMIVRQIEALLGIENKPKNES